MPQRSVAAAALIAALVTAFHACIHGATAQPTPAVQVRLVDASGNAGATSGRLEVYRCAWGSLCFAHFNVEEAPVACRQMGLGSSGLASVYSTTAAQSSGPIQSTAYSCSGSETSLDQCSKSASKIGCSHASDVLVSCQGGTGASHTPTEEPPAEGSLRSLKSQMGLQNNYELIEMYSCSWGTVCRSGFDNTDASVVCRELGLGSNGTVSPGSIPGSGPVWASEFGCTGREASLAQCPNATSTGTCSHMNDVIVTCGIAPQSTPAGFTEPDSSKGTDSSSGSSSGGGISGALIGAIVGAVAGVVLLGLLVWWYLARRKKAQGTGDPPKPAAPPKLSDLEAGVGGGGASSIPQLLDTVERNTERGHPMEAAEISWPSGIQSDGRSDYPVTPSSKGGYLLYGSRGSAYTSTTESHPATGSRSSQGRGRGGRSISSASTTSLSVWDNAGERVVLRARLKMLQFSNIQILRQIGSGSLGKVYLGQWREIQVAVKVLELGMAGVSGADAAGSESSQGALVQTLQKHSGLLASLRHPCLVSFLGMCADPPSLVCEYCPRGSLAQVLQVAAAFPEQAAKLDWLRRLQMLLEAARGLLYLHLHNPSITHCRLSSSNLLVDQDLTVKVADYNVSSVLASSPATYGRTKNKLPWLAPELLGHDSKPTLAADVYAFGMLMWELATWQPPWEGSSREQMAQAVAAGERPAIPEPSSLPGGSFGGFEGYKALMQQCWAQEPAARPGFAEIVKVLRAVLEAEGGTDGVVLWSPFLLSTSSQWTEMTAQSAQTQT